MTVERHESAKNIKEDILKSFRKELNQLEEILPQPKPKTKENKKGIEWKKTTETVTARKDVVKQIKKVVDPTEIAEEELITKAKNDLKNYAVNPYRFELAARELANNEDFMATLKKIDEESLRRGFIINDDTLDGMDALIG